MMRLNLGGITSALKGINGGFEINRLVGGIGGLFYIIFANFFVWYQVVWLGKEFDITAYCLAFPGGIAAIVAGTAGAVAVKDRNVASARVTEATGAIPAKPPEGPRVPVGTDVSEPAPELAPGPIDEPANL